MQLLRAHVEHDGRPVALYSDRHRIFRLTREEAANGHTVTQFGRALAGLESEAIQAHSPSAKGREGRANQTLQDRLVKELRRRVIDAMDAANTCLPELIADYHRRPARRGRRLSSARPPPRAHSSCCCPNPPSGCSRRTSPCNFATSSTSPNVS